MVELISGDISTPLYHMLYIAMDRKSLQMRPKEEWDELETVIFL